MDREIKRKIRALRKIKKQTQKKTALRRDLNRKIRELKKQREPLTPEKQALIDKIKHFYTDERIDYEQFTLEQLQYYYDTKIKGKLVVNGIINQERVKELTKEK